MQTGCRSNAAPCTGYQWQIRVSSRACFFVPIYASNPPLSQFRGSMLPVDSRFFARLHGPRNSVRCCDGSGRRQPIPESTVRSVHARTRFVRGRSIARHASIRYHSGTPRQNTPSTRASHNGLRLTGGDHTTPRGEQPRRNAGSRRTPTPSGTALCYVVLLFPTRESNLSRSRIALLIAR